MFKKCLQKLKIKPILGYIFLYYKITLCRNATMRYAKVLLTAAEALNKITAGSTEADGYLNKS